MATPEGSSDPGSEGTKQLLANLVLLAQRNEIEKVVLDILARQRNGEGEIVLSREAADQILEKLDALAKYAP